MLKKIMLGIAASALLGGVVILAMKEQSTAAAARERSTADSKEPGQQAGPGAMRGGIEPWLDELTKAYEQNDREKMGQLLEEMKQRRQRVQRGMDRPERGGPPEGMERGPMGGMTGVSSSAEIAPLAKTEAEKKILSILDDMDKNDRRGMMNVPIADGRLLRLLAEAIGAKHVVEIGTSNGYSGNWLCLALRTTGGKLTTSETEQRRASLARENFKGAGGANVLNLA